MRLLPEFVRGLAADLRLIAGEAALAALDAASAALDRRLHNDEHADRDAKGAPASEAAVLAGGEPEQEDEPSPGDVWFDASRGCWMFWPHFSPPSGIVPLDVSDPEAGEAARVAAQLLMLSAAPRVITTPAERNDGEHAVYFNQQAGRFRLIVACDRCGGSEVNLPEALPIENLDYVRLVASHALAQIPFDQGCPGCVTERMRSRQVTDEPVCWFDVVTQEWQLSRPLPNGGSACMPLGYTCFPADPEALDAAAHRFL